MLIVAAKGREHIVAEVFEKWDLEAVIVGEVTDDGLWRIEENGRLVAAIPVEALADAPKYDRPRTIPADFEARQVIPELPGTGDCGSVLLRLLASPNIADKRWVYRQYDHMVRLNTLVRPGRADAAVLRIPGTDKAVALTVDGNHVHVKADPFEGAAGVVAEAARNVACTGARPLAATDCLNFGNPERPEVMWEFERAVAGLAHGLRELSVPVVSGNVSLYNETSGTSIHPTPTLGMVGLLDDASHAITMGLRRGGDLALLLLGNPRPTLGASAYAGTIHGVEQGAPPTVHWAEERALLALLQEGVRRGWLQAAHDVADGGLAVALAEMSLAGTITGDQTPIGCTVELPAYPDPTSRDLYLFGETHGCAWAMCSTTRVPDVFSLAQELGCRVLHAGSVGGDRIVILDAHKLPAVDVAVADALDAWQGGFEKALGMHP
jgi:phosphoribosylformylglycinamidine synthase